MNLAGARVFLTGASSGIGAALAVELARRGARLALFARNEERLDKVRKSARQAARNEAAEIITFPGDVTNRERVLATIRETSETLGGIDVAIFNAGVGDSLFVDSFDSARVREIFEVNLMGVVHGIEAVLPEMLERGRGTIVGVSSAAGYRGLPQSAPYCASKSALTTFLESLRLDLAPRGIRVLTVSPVFVRTPLTDRNRFRMPFIVTAERAAAIIADGIGRGRRDIHFPRRLTLLMKILRILPVWLYDILLGAVRRRQRGDFKDPA